MSAVALLDAFGWQAAWQRRNQRGPDGGVRLRAGCHPHATPIEGLGAV